MKSAAILIAMVAVTGLLSVSRAQFSSCPISQSDLNARDFSGMQDACQGDFSTEDACDECLVSTFEPVIGTSIQAHKHTSTQGAEAHCCNACIFFHWVINLYTL